MTLKQFHIIYFIIVFILKLSMIFIFLLWAIDSYYLFRASGALEMIKNFSDFNKFSIKLENSAIKWLWSSFYLFIKIVLLMIASYCFRHFPTPMKWIKRWDETAEIPTILGKKIVNHLRFYNNISFEDFIYLKAHAQAEKMMLNHQSENEIKKQLFLKYDREFKEDLN